MVTLPFGLGEMEGRVRHLGYSRGTELAVDRNGETSSLGNAVQAIGAPSHASGAGRTVCFLCIDLHPRSRCTIRTIGRFAHYRAWKRVACDRVRDERSDDVGIVRYGASMSIDGYVGGEDDERLREWMMRTALVRREMGLEGGEENADSELLKEEEEHETIRAIIMGRNMFGGGPGPWPEDPPWNGWWGDEPPMRMPVFVLTHHPRPKLELKGGNSFTFVTEGIERALGLARETAGDGDVGIWGGGSTAAQFISRGLVDVIELHVVPAMMGGGVRLFDLIDLTTVKLEQTRAREGIDVTHLWYRVTRL